MGPPSCSVTSARPRVLLMVACIRSTSYKVEVKRKGLTGVNGPTTGWALSSRMRSSLSCLVACPVLQSGGAHILVLFLEGRLGWGVGHPERSLSGG
jgi:hypothetical protein